MTARLRRFTAADPCPVCGGHDGLNRGQGLRCHGYYDRTGAYARCSREEKAGDLPRNADGTYTHRIRGRGQCHCGQSHGQSHSQSQAPAGKARPAAPGVLKRRAEQRFRSFHTLAAYLRKRYGDGTNVRHWAYRDAAGAEAFRILRVDYRAPDGSPAKSYRPCHKASDGRWLLSRPALPLPLYRLPSLLATPPEATVAILEGEKCTDLATALGLPYATTSAHGAKAPQLSDWTPLSGRTVAILGDADADGLSYVTQIAAILATLDPPAQARIVTLPGLSDGEDIEQWIAHRRQSGQPDTAILAELHTLIAPSR